MKKFLWAFLVPSFALAQPSPEIVKWVQNSMHPGIHVNDEGDRGDACNAQSIRITGNDPVTNKNRLLTISVYTPLDPANARDVLILPPTGGENFIDRGYAGSLCSTGMRVTILQKWDMDTDWDNDLATWDREALRTLAAAEHALEYLNPTKPVAILGTSLGALGASFILGYDHRIETGVLIVGGDHLDEIIAHSEQPQVADVRRKQMVANGINSIDAYQDALKRAIHLHPGTFADFSGPKKLLMFLALKDTAVPTKDQQDLAKVFGSPKTEEYNGSHVETILHTYFNKEEDVVSFLAGKHFHRASQATGTVPQR
jgi:hypothetical protein